MAFNKFGYLFSVVTLHYTDTTEFVPPSLKAETMFNSNNITFHFLQ